MTTKQRIKRPTKVKVGYMVYQIQWLTDTEWTQSNRHPDWGGGSEHEEGRIVLRVVPGRNEDSLRETLLHEILHCVWVAVSMNQMFRYSKADSSDYEEMVISSTSPTLLAVLAENPAVLAYLINLGQPA